MENTYINIRKDIAKVRKTLQRRDYRVVETSRQLEALVDTRHFKEVSRYRWYAIVSRNDYVSVAGDVDGARVSMQRLIIALETGQLVKDIKHVTFVNKVQFDCRFQNLLTRNDRTAIMQNRRPKRNTTSAFKGIHKKEKPNGGHYWRVGIKAPIGAVNLGQYDNELEAALVYDAAAKQLFEDAAFLNFPDQTIDADAAQLASDRIKRFKNSEARKAQGRSL